VDLELGGACGRACGGRALAEQVDQGEEGDDAEKREDSASDPDLARAALEISMPG
jgi:hypothetical protein